jgi:hypothetical protein
MRSLSASGVESGSRERPESLSVEGGRVVEGLPEVLAPRPVSDGLAGRVTQRRLVPSWATYNKVPTAMATTTTTVAIKVFIPSLSPWAGGPDGVEVSASEVTKGPV